MLFPALGSSAAAFRIPHSVRFNSADSAYLARTPGVAGNLRTFTMSAWVKRSAFGTTQGIFGSNFNYESLSFDTSDRLVFSGIYTFGLTTNAVFRDPGAWYHIVAQVDTTQATSTDRLKLWVNGAQITSFASSSYPTLNATATDWNQNKNTPIGAQYIVSGPAGFLSGYLAGVHWIDGFARTASDFGESSPSSGVWVPKKYSGSFGTNGFHLDFSDDTLATSSALGKDRSGNNNDWTPTNISVGTSGFDVDRDVYTDTPTNYSDGGNGRGNYCTLNPLDSSEGLGSPQLKNGALEHHYQSAGWQEVRGTIGVSTGKWYWEVTVTNVGSGGSFALGIRSSLGKNVGGVWWHSGSWSSSVNGTNYGYKDDAQKTSSGSQSAYGATFTTGDVIGVALDMDAGTITFYKNGVSQGVAHTSLVGEFTPAVDMNVNAHAKCNFGQRAFKHTPPAGHLALCSQNLPTPAIVRSNTGFETVSFAGTGGARSITGLAFGPDLVWIKQRSSPANSHNVYDSTRGAILELATDTTAIEASVAQGLTTFAANGFSLGTDGGVNENALNFVAWCWEESVAAGLDIRTFTGTGAAQNVSHNLGKVPDFIIYKPRSASGSWQIGHRSLNAGTTPWNYALQFTNAAQATASTVWNNTAPTSSQFTVGSAAANTITQIAYVFTEVVGFSRFGTYTGDGTSNGPFVYCGFRPRFILIKAASATGEWKIHDTVRDGSNPSGNDLIAETNAAEAVGSNILDITSNGFKLRGTSSNYNSSGVAYIFAAFAEAPLKFARAR